MKIYRQVKCSDRLPKENIWIDTNIGYIKFDTSDSRWLVSGGVVTWWLEEIKLPSEEEVYSESFTSDKTPNDFIKGANFILNKLKNG